RSVSRASSGLGVGSPLGWLWTTISPVVPGVTHAGTKTSGIETGVLSRVPRRAGATRAIGAWSKGTRLRTVRRVDARGAVRVSQRLHEGSVGPVSGHQRRGHCRLAGVGSHRQVLAHDVRKERAAGTWSASPFSFLACAGGGGWQRITGQAAAVV